MNFAAYLATPVVAHLPTKPAPQRRTTKAVPHKTEPRKPAVTRHVYEYKALLVEEPRTVEELSELLKQSKPGVYGVLVRMLKRGLVEKVGYIRAEGGYCGGGRGKLLWGWKHAE